MASAPVRLAAFIVSIAVSKLPLWFAESSATMKTLSVDLPTYLRQKVKRHF
jgi:hypothetical protein